MHIAHLEQLAQAAYEALVEKANWADPSNRPIPWTQLPELAKVGYRAAAQRVAEMTARGDQPLLNSDLDEPVFVLCARDPVAPQTVRDWANHAQRVGAPMRKIDKALGRARALEDWQQANGTKDLD